MMAKRVRFIFLLFVVMAVGCRSSSDPSPLIATLKGQEIHRAEFESFITFKVGDITSSETADSLRSQMLDEYIRRRLVLDEAARAGLSVTGAEIEQAAQESPQIKAAAAAADTREELMRDLLVQKYYRQVLLRDVRVSDEEIQKYIEQNQTRLTDKPGFFVREIRVQ
jgi:SurA-like protein